MSMLICTLGAHPICRVKLPCRVWRRSSSSQGHSICSDTGSESVNHHMRHSSSDQATKSAYNFQLFVLLTCSTKCYLLEPQKTSPTRKPSSCKMIFSTAAVPTSVVRCIVRLPTPHGIFMVANPDGPGKTENGTTRDGLQTAEDPQ